MKKILFTLFVIITAFLNAIAQQTTLNKPTDDVCVVNFMVMDYELIPEESAEIEIILQSNKVLIAKGVSDVEGKFSVNLEEGKKYDILVKKFKKTFDFELDIPRVDGPLEFNQKLKIRLITRYVRTYTLENVYFDVDKYNLRPDSYTALNTLLAEMQRNPKMKIELAGHTDSDGDDKHNMTLSQNRSNSVMNYLIEKGISSDRIIAKGYGETVPIVTNDTPANKQKNRRTEVRVIEE